jgi:transposase
MSWWAEERTDALNPLSSELNPICYLLALLAHDFLHVSRIMIKSLTLRLLMLYIYDISNVRVKLLPTVFWYVRSCSPLEDE